MFFRTINPWESEGLKRRLLHYYRLLNEASTYNAYYRICKRIPAEFSKNGGIKDLWKLHEEKKAYFEQNRFSLVEKDLNNSEIPPRSFLDLKIRLACQMLKECDFCERKCGIDRSEDETGYCGVPEDSYLSSKFLHHGEEPVLVPSGTIFFGGCNLGCVFCQNADISNAGKTYELSQAGNPVSAKELADIAGKLVDSGALNVNYVGGDPIPNLHTILESLSYQTHNRCQLWNSNFYNSLASLKLLSDVMDVWLPDFKYGNNECGRNLSKIPDYWDMLRRNFKYVSSHGSANIIVRHLVMPNHTECCSKPILKWLGETMPDKVVVNIMGQYRPEHLVNAKNYPNINRRPTRAEMKRVEDLADKYGVFHNI